MVYNPWWWFGTMDFYDCPYGNFIIPTDEVIFFRGVGIPPTSVLYIYGYGSKPIITIFWGNKPPLTSYFRVLSLIIYQLFLIKAAIFIVVQRLAFPGP